MLYSNNINKGLDSKEVRELLKSMEELANYHIKIKLDQLRNGYTIIKSYDFVLLQLANDNYPLVILF
ncbi:MAG: hypothetical protein ACW99A_18185 [Candidatus Kariarchaeaceae archaeon]